MRRPDLTAKLRNLFCFFLTVVLVATTASVLAPSVASASAQHPLYIAFGDSFASGTGSEGPQGYQPWAQHTSFGNSCNRSWNAYPEVVPQFGRVVFNGNFTYYNETCDGATTGWQLSSDGSQACVGVSTGAQVPTCNPTNNVLKRQLQDAVYNQTVAGNSADFVSVSVIGDDLDFADVMHGCVLGGGLPSFGGDCNRAIAAATAAATYQNPFTSNQDPNSISVRLAWTYALIRAFEPNAFAYYGHAVVMLYPHLFNWNGQTCNGTGNLTSQQEINMNNAIDVLDQNIQQIAGDYGYDALDPRPAFSTHEICSGRPDGFGDGEWVNGLGITNGTNDSFHPNQWGQQEFTNLVLDAFWPFAYFQAPNPPS